MRGFMVLCLSAVALAAPQGYNYQQPISGGFSGGISSGSSGFSGGSFSSGGGSFGGGGGSGFSSGGGGFGGGRGVGLGGGDGFGGSSFGGSSFGGGSFGGAVQHQAPIVTKHFHSFSAPEEHEDASIHKQINVGTPHKHYRVVFIKAPHQNAAQAAVTVAQAQNEEKTVIYVLSRKTDAADIQANIQAAPHNPTKPEVFFIKYKTQEEAAHAQQQIQAQYDSLGGSSQVTDEGLAPVTSVIGSVGGGHGGARGGSIGGSIGGSFGGSSIGHAASPGGAYLPPN